MPAVTVLHRARRLKSCLFAATLMTAPAVAHAQAAAPAAPAAASGPQLEEVVVTARRQQENLQTVPVAITPIPQQVFHAGVFEASRFNEVAPGLHVAASVSDRNNVTFNIRGQGYAYGTTFPAVIPYFAEVPIVADFSNGNLFDLDNVQVLRGPQGVQFGRVTDGGNVLIEPKHPTNEFGGYAMAQAGNYGMYGLEGAVNVPIVQDKVLLRVAGQMQRRDGFTTNVFNGQKVDDVNFQTWRVGLMLRPTDNLESYTVVQYNQSRDNGTSTKLSVVNPAGVLNTVSGLFSELGPLYTGLLGPGVPLTGPTFLAALQTELARQNALGPRKTYLNVPLYDKRHNFYAVNKTTFELNDSLSFKNILGYVRTTDRQSSDYDGSVVPYIDTTHAYLPFFAMEQISEEFQLHGRAMDNHLTYTAGFYTDYQHPSEPFENYNATLGILARDQVNLQTTRSRAGYLQGEYDFGDYIHGFKINAGVRQTRDTVNANNVSYLSQLPSPAADAVLGPPPPFPHGVCTTYTSVLGTAACFPSVAVFHATTWTFGASEQFTPDHFGYVKYSRGYRPGGVNTSPPTPEQGSYEPEYDKSLELGLKSDWSFGPTIKARSNIALFRDNYTNIQKLVTEIGIGGIPTSITTNAAAARIQGVEFEGTLLPMEGLEVKLQYAYTEAHFENIANTPDSVLFGDGAVTPTPNAGACNPNAFVVLGFCYLNRFNDTPKNAVTLDAHYTLPLDDHIGKVTFGGSFFHQSSAALGDASVLTPDIIEPGYSLLNFDANWEHPYGSPVTLAFFMTNATDTLFRIAPNSLSNNGSVGIAANIYGPPRMFGFSLRYPFGGER